MPGGLDRPIIVLGAARSGTHLLAAGLARHPDVAYWSEPNAIWKYSNAGLGHDMIPSSRATDRVKAYIRGRFEARCREQDKPRFVEKTPSNGLRVPFVLEVLPEARLIHIIRDGRHVVASACRKFRGNAEKITTAAPSEAKGSPGLGNLGLIRQAARRTLTQQMPLRDLVHYLPKATGVLLAALGVRRVSAWGPEFPGMRRLMKTHPLVDVCALQWQLTVDAALNAVACRPEVPYLEVRFEDLVADHDAVMRKVYDFAELPQPDQVPQLDQRGFDAAVDPFERDFTPEERRIVLDRIGHTLRSLGYL